MKRLLILFLISILALSSCASPNDSANNESMVDTSGHSTDVLSSSAALSTSIQNSATSFLRESGFTVSGMALSDDKASAVYYVWADNYGNGTSLTLEDAEKLARDFCIENSLSENAITVEKGGYASTDIGFSGGVEGISDEEFNRLETEGHPLATIITELCERNFESEYSVFLEDEKLHIILCDGISYSDLHDAIRFIINEYLEYIVIE